MKKIVILSLVLVFAISSTVFAAPSIMEMLIPDYKVMINDEEIEVKGNVVNDGQNSFVKLRTVMEGLKNCGVSWDEENRVARFFDKELPKQIDLYESQKAVVRIAVEYDGQEAVADDPATEDEDETQEAIKGGITVIGNGFFVEGRKILTTRDVYDVYKYVLGNNDIGTDTGNPLDTITNVTGIKVILWDDTVKDAKNFRFDDDRILGTLDTLGYTSKEIVVLGDNMKVEDTAYMCTSIESNLNEGDENPIQVANQWSVNKVLRTRYARDNQYFTLIKNNTDNHDSGRGGAVFNQEGELTGIFSVVEKGNNGNAMVKPVSEIKEFLND